MARPTEAFALILAAAALGAPARAQTLLPFTIAETGKRYAELAEAVDAIGEGEGTIRIAPGRYRGCAVQESGRIAFVAEQRGTAIFDGGICEGKASLVLRGLAARVDGLVFISARVDDGNGAGIRIETGDLIVSYTRFADSQCGILSAADPNGAISIDHSTFAGLGNHADASGVHSLYIGRYGSLKVTNSRFERGTSGHYLKSRAARIQVLDSSFDDSRGRATNYMIDLPNGAVGRISGNMFVNGVGKENYGTMIAVGAEERVNSSAGLTIEDNEASLAPGFRWPSAFVGNWSGERIVLRGNRLAPGIALVERR